MATQPNPMMYRQGPPMKYRPKLSGPLDPTQEHNNLAVDPSQPQLTQSMPSNGGNIPAPNDNVTPPLQLGQPTSNPDVNAMLSNSNAALRPQALGQPQPSTPAPTSMLSQPPPVQARSNMPGGGGGYSPYQGSWGGGTSNGGWGNSNQNNHNNWGSQRQQPQSPTGPQSNSSTPQTSAAPTTQPSQPPAQPWTPQTYESSSNLGQVNPAASKIQGYARGGIVKGSAKTDTTQSQPATVNPPSVSGGLLNQNNPYNSRDVYNQNQTAGQNAYQTTQGWLNNYTNLADYYNQQGAATTTNLNDQINSFANGQGGYTPGQQGDIVRNSDYSGIQGDQQNNLLTPQEQTAIQGDPGAAERLFGPQAAALSGDAADEGTNLQNSAASGATQGNSVVDQFGKTVNNSINPANLSLSAGYKPGVDSALQLGQKQLTDAQGNPALTPTAQYLKQAGMTDQEVQDTAESAARGVGAQYGATKDALIQNTRAAGEGSPLAIASAEGALDRSSSADQADALTQARLGARQQQINAATGVQGTQLNAGQYQAGLGSQNALAEQNTSISADTTAEQLRLAANSNLASTQLGAGQTLASLGLNNSQANTQNEMNAFATGGQAGIGVGEFNANTSTGLTQTAEENSATRANALATNRQSVNQGNEGMNYNIAGSLSNQYQAAYQPGVAGKTTALNATGNQQSTLLNAGNNSGQLALGGWQQGTTAQNQAANNYSNWGQNQQTTAGVTGAINNIATLANAGANVARAANPYNSGSGGGHAKGGLITDHQTIEVGEGDRPEAILPLDPATPPEHRNKWEKLGVQLGHRLGIHNNPQSFIGHSERLPKLPGIKTHFATGGLISFDPNNPFTDDERNLDRAEDPSSMGNGYRDHYARGGVVGGGIHIKPSHAGMLHQHMVIPLGQKIPISSLMEEKRRAMVSGNSAEAKRANFAINARHWA